MALISLSDWLDRFGDAPAATSSTSELDSLRLDVSESPAPPDARAGTSVRAGWRVRLRQAWRRTFWRLRRAPSGHA
jgi:hypothetical protein